MTPSAKPRVLQMVTHLALGGAERVAFSLLHGLRDRFDFAVFAALGVDTGDVGQSMKSELAALGVPLFAGRRFPMRYGGMIVAGVEAGRAVRRFKPDIIHVHTEMPEAGYLAMTFLHPATKRIPVVRTVHNTTLWGAWHGIGLRCDRQLAHAHVAGVSNDALAAFQRLRAESKAPAGPAPVLIYNGVAVQTAPTRARAAEGPCRILFAGRFENQKGADLLPEILGKVRPPANRVHELIIYGSGHHEPQLRALASAPPPGWSVSVNGPIANLTREMPGFDLMLMPSRFEGLSLVAIEAAMLRLPVIATNGPGLREVFPDGYPWLPQAGDADSFADALQRALNAPESWTAAAELAYDYAKRHFDLSAMCDAYADVYRKALAR